MFSEKIRLGGIRKDTFRGYMLISLEYKFELVHTKLNRCYNLSFDFLKFDHEVDKLKKTFWKNASPQNFYHQCIQKFFNNIQMPQIATVQKKEVIIISPYLDKMFQIFKTRLNKTMTRHEIL